MNSSIEILFYDNILDLLNYVFIHIVFKKRYKLWKLYQEFGHFTYKYLILYMQNIWHFIDDLINETRLS